MRIAICGLIKSQNLGERFIANSLAWIIKEELKEKGISEMPNFVFVDIFATNDFTALYSNKIVSRVHNLYDYSYFGLPVECLYHGLKTVASKSRSSGFRNVIYKMRHGVWWHARNLGIRYTRYYEDKFKDVDLIVIDGAGLLEYSYNEYQEPLNLITLYAEKHSIPVVFNAIGRAGEFDENDYRCQVLIETFQRNCVKYVSARDSKESVQECVGGKFNVKLLADAAFCICDAYNKTAKPKEKLIGIGLIRGNACLSYGDGFGKEELIVLFCDIAKELSNRGFKYEFFTNGLKQDYIFGLEVISKLGISKDSLVERPIDEKDLLNTISSYSGIITCRMHSSIAAFSIGIPSVILSWNNKVDKYMEIVGYPQRAIRQEHFNAKYIVDRLEQAIIDGISVENRRRMKDLAKESARDYINLLT